MKVRRLRRGARRRPSNGSRVAPRPRRLLQHGIRTGKLGALILLGYALWALFYVLTSPRFTVRSVEVLNSYLQKPSQVAQLAGVRGKSLWLINPTVVVQRVLTSSYVETATIRLGLPNYVTIAVGERQPAIRWSAGGVQYLVDSEGLVLGVASRPVPQPLSGPSQPISGTFGGPSEPVSGILDVPDQPISGTGDAASEADSEPLVVFDTSHPALNPGDQLDPDALELARALAIRLPQELNLIPKRIEWDIGYGISVITQNEQQIAFGRKNDKNISLDVKIATLQKLLEEGVEFRFLDLRTTMPYYR